MSMQQLVTGLGLVTLLSAPAAYAADCSTTFTQGCLSRPYHAGQVADDYDASSERLDQLKQYQREEQQAWEAAVREEEAARREEERRIREQERREWERQRARLGLLPEYESGDESEYKSKYESLD